MNRVVPPLMSRALALALLVLVVGFAWIVIVEPIRADFENQETRFVRATTLLARYEKALSDEPILRTEIERLRKNDGSPDPFLKGESTQIIAANLQNQIQTFVAGEPGNIRSIQVLPESEEDGFEKIGLRVTLTAGIPTMQKIFYDIESSVPALFVDNLDIRTNVRRRRRNVESTNRVQIRFDVFGYRKRVSSDAS
ncbi:MAG: type II secretion system protein GspM [Alphaproteobacteria bacterium]|nr:type II secretion system protein GspM [Alphaproteobacteria bacterium]